MRGEINVPIIPGISTDTLVHIITTNIRLINNEYEVIGKIQTFFTRGKLELVFEYEPDKQIRA